NRSGVLTSTHTLVATRMPQERPGYDRGLRFKPNRTYDFGAARRRLSPAGPGDSVSNSYGGGSSDTVSPFQRRFRIFGAVSSGVRGTPIFAAEAIETHGDTRREPPNSPSLSPALWPFRVQFVPEAIRALSRETAEDVTARIGPIRLRTASAPRTLATHGWSFRCAAPPNTLSRLQRRGHPARIGAIPGGDVVSVLLLQSHVEGSS